MTEIRAIETRYAGCRFRSRLEARWAVFFDNMGISWQYEPQGFIVADRPYLPDFLLEDCGTWVEVKGSETELDRDLMVAAAEHLPAIVPRGEPGPPLMILGPIPAPPTAGDWGWIALDSRAERIPWPDAKDGVPDWLYPDAWSSRITTVRCGFGLYAKNRRPWYLDNCGAETSGWLTPVIDLSEYNGASDAYQAARSARFEHGEAS
jgi:hypothetical protein